MFCPGLGDYEIPDLGRHELKQWMRDRGLSCKTVEASAGHLIYVWPAYCSYVGGVAALAEELEQWFASITAGNRQTKFQ